MPLYVYKCPVCGEVFEELVLKKDQVIVCPSCANENGNERDIAAEQSSFILNGDCWARDNYSKAKHTRGR